MYAFGCANSFIQIMVYPLLSRFLSSRLCRLSSSGKFCFRERCLYRSEEFGDITNWDVLAGIIGYSVGMVWLYMSLCIPQAGEHYTFYWVAQDVLGFCMCVTFLGLIKLNSIKVAATLLIVAFFYDIFFVFVTPYLFKGRSVMIEVAVRVIVNTFTCVCVCVCVYLKSAKLLYHHFTGRNSLTFFHIKYFHPNRLLVDPQKLMVCGAKNTLRIPIVRAGIPCRCYFLYPDFSTIKEGRPCWDSATSSFLDCC